MEGKEPFALKWLIDGEFSLPLNAWRFLARAKTKRELRCNSGTVPAAVRPVQVSNHKPLWKPVNGQTGRRSEWAKSEDLPPSEDYRVFWIKNLG